MNSITTIFMLMIYNFGVSLNWLVGLTPSTMLLMSGAFSVTTLTISSRRCLLMPCFGSIAPKQGVLQKVWTSSQ